MGRHWHVLAGLQGLYMPETNDVYESRAEAREGAGMVAEAWQEDRPDLEMTRHCADYYRIGQFSVEVTECDSPDCNCEGE